MKKPIKYSLLKYSYDKNNSFSLDEAMRSMENIYGNEKSTREHNIRKQLDMFCGIGMMNATNLHFDEKDKLTFDYIITDAGRDCIQKQMKIIKKAAD